MKQIIYTFFISLSLSNANAQQQQGRVLYERTVQMRMQGMGGEQEEIMARSVKDKLEVLFSANQSLRRSMPEEIAETFQEDGRGLHLRVGGPASNELVYADFSTGHRVEQQEFAAKNYVITDSIRKLNWKLTEDTLTILGYSCRKATSQRMGKHKETLMEHGEMKNRDVLDTVDVIAWFTMAIPVPAGPECEGQLPGLILALDFGNGRVVYRAIEVSSEVELHDIKAPSKGKKVSLDEFVKERDTMISDMQRKGGRRGPLRIGG